MSIEHCDYCDNNIDTDFESEHFDDTEYDCECCDEEWSHGGCVDSTPDLCPLCCMPISQLFSETFGNKDYFYPFFILYKRLVYKMKK